MFNKSKDKKNVSLSFIILWFLGDLIYAVNGPTSPLIPVRGFTINPMTENIIDHWKLSNDSINSVSI